MARKVGRRVALLLLALVSSPLGPELRSAEADAVPADSAPVGPIGEPASSDVLVLEPGADVPSAQLEHAFVVVRRKDGRVPRAWLWDEPLGCPDPPDPPEPR